MRLYDKIYRAYRGASRICDGCTDVTKYPTIIKVLHQHRKQTEAFLSIYANEIPTIERLLWKMHIYTSENVKEWVRAWEWTQEMFVEWQQALDSYVAAWNNYMEGERNRKMNPYKPPVKVLGFVKYAREYSKQDLGQDQKVCGDNGDRSADTGRSGSVLLPEPTETAGQSQPEPDSNVGHGKGSTPKKRRATVRKKRVDSQGEGTE